MPYFSGPEMLLRIPALLIAISFHEYAHARVSYALGDPTPKWTGRLTLNPLAHLDPIGLLMLWLFKFGWAKPVMVDPRYYANKNGIVLTSLAGPLMNFLLAFVTLVIIKLNVFGGLFTVFLEVLFSYNLVLAVFNLLPVAPLDGYKILSGFFLPSRMSDMLVHFETYGPLILIFLVYFDLVDIILNPFISISLHFLDALSDILLIFRF